MVLFSNQEKNYYIKILSDRKTPRMIQSSLQSLFFELEQGKRFDPYSDVIFSKILANFIKKSKDERIRLWSYKIGCFLHSNDVVKAAKDKIIQEVNPENVMWIVSLVSSHTSSDREFTSFLTRKAQSLSIVHIKLACYLFGNRFSLQKDELIQLEKSHDKLILTWLETIHAYGHIAKYYNGESGVRREFIEDLTRHHDEDIAKYAVGALWKNGDFSVERIKFDFREHKKLNDKTKKWFYTSIWQDRMFIELNHDFIDEVLSKYNLSKCSDIVREGLARGLAEYTYDPLIVGRVIEWYINEDSETVKLFLIKYMTRWRKFNGDYFEMVKTESEKGDIELKGCIERYKKVLIEKGGQCMKIFIGSSIEARSEMERIAVLIEKLGHTCILWDDPGAFVAGNTTLESLAELSKRADAAIFVFNGDDKTWYRGSEEFSVRDNVLLEYGIFLGAKGTKKAIFICKDNPKIATDLLGVNCLYSTDGDNTLREKLKNWIDKIS